MGLFGVVSDLQDESETIAAKGILLNDNFPNPFIQATKKKYILPFADHIELDIFTTEGRLAARLVNGKQAAGA